MASRRSKRDDDSEAMFSRGSGRRRRRSEDRKKSSRSFESFDESEGRRRRFSKPSKDDLGEYDPRRGWLDTHLDEREEEDATYTLGFDEDLDPDLDTSLYREDLEDSEIDQSADDWQ